jgi:hypothetical protein
MILYFGAKKMKLQKPININCHLEYRCPNNECYYTHWLSLKETQTKNFKVVCECGFIFKPKQIKSLDVVYEEKIEPKTETKEINIPKELLNQASPLLQQYGFTKAEADNILSKTYKNNPFLTSTIDLVKLSLQSLEIKNV